MKMFVHELGVELGDPGEKVMALLWHFSFSLKHALVTSCQNQALSPYLHGSWGIANNLFPSDIPKGLC